MARWQRSTRRDPAGEGAPTEADVDPPGLDGDPGDPGNPEPDVPDVPDLEQTERPEDLDELEEPEEVVEVSPAGGRPPASAGRLRLSVTQSPLVTLPLAAHPRHAVVTAAGMGIAAAASGRALRECLLVVLTVLVGQTVLGWHNDILDRQRDARHDVARKPLADGRLDPGTAWYALAIGVLVLVPLSIATGVTAGIFYLSSVVVGVLSNVLLRRGVLSWLPWAASYALFACYLSYGGWGGDAEGSAPQPVMVVLAALLGIGVHLLLSIWGLVADDAEGWRPVPLLLGRRLGATRLLVVSLGYLGVVLALIVVLGTAVGLRA